MRLATVRHAKETWAARVDGNALARLPFTDVGELLRQPDWLELAATGGELTQETVESAHLAPVIPAPSKVICVGLNYRDHILETGNELPEYPALFTKFPESLTGPRDQIVLPRVSECVDWEVELCVVVGREGRYITEASALEHIAGYTVSNDVSMRDWQRRTSQWMQGKAFEAVTPVGPVLVTSDELADGRGLEVVCEVDGEVMQRAMTSELVFGPAELVSYASRLVTLKPGDLILTGTPGGIGMARTPQIYLKPGQTLRSSIDGIGSCENLCVADEGAWP